MEVWEYGYVIMNSTFILQNFTPILPYFHTYLGLPFFLGVAVGTS